MSCMVCHWVDPQTRIANLHPGAKSEVTRKWPKLFDDHYKLRRSVPVLARVDGRAPRAHLMHYVPSPFSFSYRCMV
jgi:hypothetical protein